jgi:hypothetical protein
LSWQDPFATSLPYGMSWWNTYKGKRVKR